MPDPRGKELSHDAAAFTWEVLDSLAEHIAVLDGNGLIIKVNEAWLRFARENGAPSASIGPGMNYFDVCRSSSVSGDALAGAALDGIRSVMDGSRELFTMVYPCHSPSEQRWFMMTVRPFRLHHFGVVVSHTDVTECKNIEELLHESKKRLSYLLDAATEGAWDWNIKTGEVYYSPTWIRSLGYSPDEVPGHISFWEGIIHPEDMPAAQLALKEHFDGKKALYDVENRLRMKSGEYRWNIDRGKVVERDTGGRPLRMVGINIDITERRQKEEELRSAHSEIIRLKELLAAENVCLGQDMRFELGIEDIIGESEALSYVLYRVGQVAPTDMTVLILGETGTGKGRIAYAIHKASNRRKKPLIHVNCASLPANLIESEMFGREKGAFTGAEARQIGRFELAHQGTIFLDEIGELSLPLQAKLLRVIEDGEFERLGSPHTVKVDARIIASTNRNLEEEVRKGTFRQDLFYRLNVFPITVPPLRQRGDDVLLLVRHYVRKFGLKYKKNITTIPDATMDALKQYRWPGNVRELSNVIERAVITSRSTVLELAEKIDDASGMQAEQSKDKSLTEVERAHIMRVLEETGWKIEGPKGAARPLKMNPSTLRARMRKLGIKRPGS